MNTYQLHTSNTTYVIYGYKLFTDWPFSTVFGHSDNDGGQDPSLDCGPELADSDQEPDAHDPGPLTAAQDPLAWSCICSSFPFHEFYIQDRRCTFLDMHQGHTSRQTDHYMCQAKLI